MKIELKNHIISENHNPFIIAEIGSNHQGNMVIAKKLIDEAYNCGVSAVKFQTKDIETAFSKEMLDQSYENSNSFGSTYREHKEALELSIDQFEELKIYSEKKNLVCFSTPFDIKSLVNLEKINQEIYKISSFHVVDHDLIEAICKTQKPIIMSTGMSTQKEIDQAVELIRKYTNNFAILHCVSSYPTKVEEMNLSVIKTLRTRYKCLVGYSGHETNANIAPSTILYNACIIERHFTLDRTMKGTDHAASLEPPGMSMLVKRSQSIFQARGSSEITVLESELKNRKKFRGY